MHRLLITGGAGFIGANFMHYWLQNHPRDRVVVLDALTYAGNPANLDAARNSDAFRFVHGDVCDARLVDELMAGEEIDWIVHFAAESHVDRSIDSSGQFVRTNVLGTHTLLEAARKCWTGGDSERGRRFHQVSTDEVYGSLDAAAPRSLEASPYAPRSPYAASKACADHLVRAYAETYALPVTISIGSNTYGALQFPEKLLPLAIVSVLEGKPIPVYGDGLQIRDWLHVDDHCRAIDAVLNRGRAGESYNVGANEERPNIDVVKTLCASIDGQFAADGSLKGRFPNCPAAGGTATQTLIRFISDRPGHDRRYAMDSGKIAAELGFRPAVVFESGMQRTVQWYLANERWWRGVMDERYREWIDRQYRAR